MVDFRSIEREIEKQERHEARAINTHRALLKKVAKSGALSVELAERATVAVLCALEHRLFGKAPEQLEAQLPKKLRELVHACPLHASEPPRKFKREEFLHLIAEEVGCSRLDAERLARVVIGELRFHISPGENEQLLRQLPKDIATFWREASLEAINSGRT